MSSAAHVKPNISVVLPTYNRAYVVDKSINSILGQTYTDFELIIVDDGSTDNTAEIVASYKDPRIRYIKHGSNKGLSAGRNTGIRNANGLFIGNLDSDDIWTNRKLEREVKIFKERKTLGVVFSRMKKKFPDGKELLIPTNDFSIADGNLYTKLLKGNFITMQAALIKKECFEKVGLFDESLPALQDWDQWIRISKHYSFGYTPEIGVYAYILNDSITRNKRKRHLAREMIFKKHNKAFSEYGKVYSRHAYTIGHAHALYGNTALARPFLKNAMRRSKFINLKYILAYLLSILGGRMYRKLSAIYAKAIS